MTLPENVQAALDENPSMFTDAGNQAVRERATAIAEELISVGSEQFSPTATRIRLAFREGANRVHGTGHPEVYDTEPRTYLAYVRDMVLEHYGYQVNRWESL